MPLIFTTRSLKRTKFTFVPEGFNIFSVSFADLHSRLPSKYPLLRDAHQQWCGWFYPLLTAKSSKVSRPSSEARRTFCSGDSGRRTQWIEVVWWCDSAGGLKIGIFSAFGWTASYWSVIMVSKTDVDQIWSDSTAMPTMNIVQKDLRRFDRQR